MEIEMFKKEWAGVPKLSGTPFKMVGQLFSCSMCKPMRPILFLKGGGADNTHIAYWRACKTKMQ